MALVFRWIFTGLNSEYSPGHQRHLGEANKTNIYDLPFDEVSTALNGWVKRKLHQTTIWLAMQNLSSPSWSCNPTHPATLIKSDQFRKNYSYTYSLPGTIKAVLTSSIGGSYFGFINFSQAVLVSRWLFAGSIQNLMLYESSKYLPGHQCHLGEANKTNI